MEDVEAAEAVAAEDAVVQVAEEVEYPTPCKIWKWVTSVVAAVGLAVAAAEERVVAEVYPTHVKWGNGSPHGDSSGGAGRVVYLTTM